MKRINEIFYSLQGEGRNTGRAAVFIRFAGCNLRCPFCDTEFDTYREMADEEILAEVERCHEGARGKLLVVLTGGEPTLQADEDFVGLLHQHGYEVAMESNGTRPAPRNLDWLTVSPKGNYGGERMPDEIKVVFDEHTDPEAFLCSHTALLTPQRPLLYLQPCDTGDAGRNDRILQRCIAYIMQHPWWRLSLQTHKMTGIK